MSVIVEIIGASVTTASIIISGIVCLLKSYYVSRKDFDEKLNDFKKEIREENRNKIHEIKQSIDILANKIENMGEKYVTMINFKMYSDSVNQLFQLYNEKTDRIETVLDNLAENINEFMRKHDRDD